MTDIDMDELNAGTADLLQMLQQNATPRQRFQQAQQMDRLQEAEDARKMTDEDRAAAAARQVAHAEKLKIQRAETAAREAEAEAARVKAAKKQVTGIMGVGRVPVDVGDVEAAYEFHLKYSEVDIYVPLPAGVKAKQLAVDVGVRSLSIGLKGAAPYLKGALQGPVQAKEMVWTVEDGKVKIELMKAKGSEAQAWDGALALPDGWVCKW